MEPNEKGRQGSAENVKNAGNAGKQKKQSGACESCEFFEDDETYGPSCTVCLDEDEFIGFLSGQTNACPYYRYYDEYETVRHQN